MSDNFNLNLLRDKFNGIHALHCLVNEALNAQSVLNMIITDPQIRQKENLEELKELSLERLNLLENNISNLRYFLNLYTKQ